jgi:hypothetical protein
MEQRKVREAVARNLRALGDLHGLRSTRECAGAAGVSATHMAGILDQSTACTIDVIERMAARLNVSPMALVEPFGLIESYIQTASRDELEAITHGTGSDVPELLYRFVRTTPRCRQHIMDVVRSQPVSPRLAEPCSKCGATMLGDICQACA